jgi:hypothetical protein
MSSPFIGPIGRNVIVVLGIALAPACAPLRLPYKSSGPATSPEGVTIAVSRQSCTQNVDPDFHGIDLVEEVVEIKMQNATPSPVSVQRDAFRLLSPGGARLKTITWRAVDPLLLAGGETRTFDLRFMNRGAITCTGDIVLDADAGVRLAGRPVQLGAIRFQPSHAL